MSKSPIERRIKSFAYHEAGHAVAYLCSSIQNELKYVTIAAPQPHVMADVISSDSLYSSLSAIVALLAGCAAEAVVYKKQIAWVLHESADGGEGADWPRAKKIYGEAVDSWGPNWTPPVLRSN
jgi:ATP-dependent Zn protease